MLLFNKKHTIFIADLHLQPLQPQRTELFLEFLTKIANKAEALYILGDLFEVWVGDDYESEFTKKIITALHDFHTTSKIPVYLMRGNRDFLLGEKFTLAAGCILIADPTVIDLYGTPTLLTHGDILCSKDYFYQAYKKIVTCAFFTKIFSLLALTLRQKIANTIRRKSESRKQTKKAMAISPAVINKIKQKNGVKLIVNGHFHEPKIEDSQITLGEWGISGSYLIYYKNHKLKLLEFLL
jgi:UDP-2,3-diacylglucosamine hydrolase